MTQKTQKLDFSAVIKNRINEIKNVQLFENIEYSVLSQLLRLARISSYTAKKQVLRQGGEVTHIYIILSGVVKVFRTDTDGNEVTLLFAQKGDALFTSCLFHNDYAQISGDVLEDTELLAIPAENVLKTSKVSSNFAFNLLRDISEKNRQLMFMVEEITLHTAMDRLGRYLLKTKLENGFYGNEFPFGIDKSLVASHLGMTPETLSRSLKKLSREGVKVGKKNVELEYSQALCKYHDEFYDLHCPKYSTPDCPHYKGKS